MYVFVCKHFFDFALVYVKALLQFGIVIQAANDELRRRVAPNRNGGRHTDEHIETVGSSSRLLSYHNIRHIVTPSF